MSVSPVHEISVRVAVDDVTAMHVVMRMLGLHHDLLARVVRRPSTANKECKDVETEAKPPHRMTSLGTWRKSHHRADSTGGIIAEQGFGVNPLFRLPRTHLLALCILHEPLSVFLVQQNLHARENRARRGPVERVARSMAHRQRSSG
jgi:hypothetical protein